MSVGHVPHGEARVDRVIAPMALRRNLWQLSWMEMIDPARSRLMACIRRADTKPEWRVRSLLHGLGYRFRVQMRGVPGRPDVAFPAKRAAIMVHGCFWHQHAGCRHARIPTTRRGFWEEKFERNRERDSRLLAQAEALGWRVLVVWECETLDASALKARLVHFLGPTKTDKPAGRFRDDASASNLRTPTRWCESSAR